MRNWILYVSLGLLLGLGCKKAIDPARNPQEALFRLLDTAQTGVTFSNSLTETPTHNILDYLYFYNGGGVAVGDVNGDSLPDLFFTANQQANRLYLNRGDLRFEEATEAAQLAGQPGWTTGAAMVDVNGDGWLDLYVCQVAGYETKAGKRELGGHNQLYLNQGDGTFAERAAQYGLDFRGTSTQSCWFDYDRDGDLDLYLLNHSVHANDTYQRGELRDTPHPTAGDRLFRNNLVEKGADAPFTDVTAEAGIYSSALGYGLGVVASDFNRDGWPDIYVGNDFHEDDYLYLNQQDGSFRQVSRRATGHTSRFTMGLDAADFDNDGWVDLFSLDMKPWREDIRKTSEPPVSDEIYRFRLSYDYGYQYARNALQRNAGFADSLRFQEIASLLEMDATDWSWSALFADFDLDGRKDLFVTNGIYRRLNDMDYAKFASQPEVNRSLAQGVTEANLAYTQKMPSVPLPNKIFQNTGEKGSWRFEEAGERWGIAQAGFSNGAAYADLDRDGDLDLVVNNLNATAQVYENRAAQQPDRNWLVVRLADSSANGRGIGARVEVYSRSGMQVQELFPVRGFQSSVEPALFFGLGKDSVADVVVRWPSGKTRRYAKIETNRWRTFRPSDSNPQSERENIDSPTSPLIFQRLTPSQVHIAPHLLYHRDPLARDYTADALAPYRVSQEGPALAVEETSDAEKWVFFGGGANQASKLLRWKGGRFVRVDSLVDTQKEAVCAAFFDADGDGDEDLYVGYAGGVDPRLSDAKDALYLQTENGWQKSPQSFPEIQTSCVVPLDFDEDGRIDVFLGNRGVKGSYGKIGRSYLLRNTPDGFVDATPEALQFVGMVTAGAWGKVGKKGGNALVLAGDWMGVLRLDPTTGEQDELAPSGWWRSLLITDLDADGDADILAGNYGQNHELRPTPEEPVELYLGDFDQNGRLDPIVTRYRDGKPYSLYGKDAILQQIPAFRRRAFSYYDFAQLSVPALLGDALKADTRVQRVESFASVWLRNEAREFNLLPLPTAVHTAPLRSAVLLRTAPPSVLAVGNDYTSPPLLGRQDAGLNWGLTWRDDSLLVRPHPQNFRPGGDARQIIWLDARHLMIGMNDGEMQLWRVEDSLRGI